MSRAVFLYHIFGTWAALRVRQDTSRCLANHVPRVHLRVRVQLASRACMQSARAALWVWRDCCGREACTIVLSRALRSRGHLILLYMYSALHKSHIKCNLLIGLQWPSPILAHTHRSTPVNTRAPRTVEFRVRRFSICSIEQALVESCCDIYAL